jgi:hypothetical protein
LQRPARTGFIITYRDGLELFLGDRPAPESLAEHVPPTAVLTVEALCVPPVEQLQSFREVFARCVEDEVVVVRHQAEGVTCPLVLFAGMAQQPEEDSAVIVVPIDRHLCHASGGDVKDSIRPDVARDASHSLTVRTQRLPGLVRNADHVSRRDPM